MNVVFRVDASNQIGSGHVMRCLTLAELLRESGSKVSFITRSYVGNLDNLIESKGFKIDSLPGIHKFSVKKLTGYEKWLGVPQTIDAEETVKKLGNVNPDLLIIDHYSLDIEWESILRFQVKSILVIDDMANRKHDCDWLLDQNYSTDINRYDSMVSPDTVKILGPKYSLLRKEFLSYRKKINLKLSIKRVFIFFGGIDPYNLTLLSLKSLQHPKLKHLELNVVIGANNLHAKEVELFVATLDNAVLHVQVENIAELMADSDIAIGAGGSTTMERFAIGLPSIVITFGKDQQLSTKELNNDKYTTWLGSVAQVDEDKLTKAIINLIKNPSQLYDKKIMAQKLVDGNGTKRVLDLIKYGFSDNKLVSRLATIEDAKLYWEWVNDIEVRKNAFNESFIEWNEHQKWFEESLYSSSLILLVIESDSMPIGQVRFNKEGRYFKIDYSLAKQFRGKSLAIPMLNAAIDYLKTIQSFILIAEVKNSNIASLKVFEKMGFIKIEHVKGKNNVSFQLKINC